MRHQRNIAVAEQVPNAPTLASPENDEEPLPRHNSDLRSLKIRRVPTQHGWYWLIEGFTLWARHPAFLSFLTCSSILCLSIALFIPYAVGDLLSLILYPGLVLGVFNGCRAIDRKRTLSPGLLFTGFRRYAYDLLLAGFCNFVVTTLVLLATRFIDGGITLELLAYGVIPENEVLYTNPFVITAAITSVLFVFWGAVYLFVPQLIGWWRLSALKALRVSLKACLINWRPFLAYAFCYSFFLCLLAAFIINALQLTVEGMGGLFCVVFLFIVIPTICASFYVAARDIFGFPRRRKHRRHHHHQQLPQ